MAEGTRPTCFVVMPITTPAALLPLYGDDIDHFAHVFEHLFEPALDAAGFQAASPVSTGSQVIQAEVIEQLEHAELVLCDLSTLNANVFFELGIRTSLNKPVCMIRDSCTENLPFDTSVVNCPQYDAALRPWTLSTEINKLVKHINATVHKAGGRNALWTYFGVTSRAASARVDVAAELRPNIAGEQIHVGESVDERRPPGMSPEQELVARTRRVAKELEKMYPGLAIRVLEPGRLWVDPASVPSTTTFDVLVAVADGAGVVIVH